LKKKKLVYVVESMGSGVLTYLNQLSNHLDNEFEITILYGVRKQTPKNIRQIFNKDIKLIKINNFQRSINFFSDYKAYLEIKQHIYRIHPDIVHLNSSKAGVLGRVLKFIHFNRLKNTKFYYTSHGYAFLMLGASKTKRVLYYMIEKILGNLNTKTIACGYGEYKYAKKISNNSTYINNSVDIDKLNQYWSEDSNTKDVVFTIGRISEQKNPILFNEIALNNPDKKFVWIGDGDDKDKLSSPNIEITGWMNNDELLTKIQPYKYFILCSKWEGLPLSLLEAMYFKKNCFVTNVIGNRDVIEDGTNGYIIYGNIDDLVFKYSDDISMNSNDTIFSDYNLNKMLDNYNNIYNL
jgi:glycosyltransferase involved in cell wall biosynthesis